jgi:hypothetical protein
MSTKGRPHLDPRHFEGKTIRELQEMLKQAEEFVKKYPQFEYGYQNEYRQELRKYIAEKIGR